MTSTNLKKHARAYMAANDVSYTTALRAVSKPADVPAWISGATPWLRRLAKPFTCYWCGEADARLSWGDVDEDAQRVEFYCNNPQCTVREADVLVIDDGTSATPDRADVKALDRNGPEIVTDAVFFDSDERVGWSVRTSPVPAVRTSSPVQCLFCGDISCVMDSSDFAEDIGRVALRCTNTACAADKLVALVGRDGTTATQSRADVSALREIDNPTPPVTADLGDRIRPVSERRVGVLARRRG